MIIIINNRQKRFVELFINTGNATDSYINAGYTNNYEIAKANASRLLTKDNIKKYLEEINSKILNERIMKVSEIKIFWSEIIKNDDKIYKTSDRLKASELLAKSEGLFLQTEDTTKEITIIMEDKLKECAM